MDATNLNSLNIKAGDHVFYRALGTTYKVLTETVGGSAGIVEHTLEAMSLGAPMHKHTREDEISFVLEGELSVIQDGQIQIATAGQFIAKPRNIFHTFWNATQKRIRFLEFIVPGNFQFYFAEMEPFLKAGQPPQFDKMQIVREKYGLIIDLYAADEIIKKYNLNKLG
ncbi:MAG: cupin domain-containing protein [Bacteroidota bacterium]|nr:cupin domain-containing protein [Bacteroidota bacterium]